MAFISEKIMKVKNRINFIIRIVYIYSFHKICELKLSKNKQYYGIQLYFCVIKNRTRVEH